MKHPPHCGGDPVGPRQGVLEVEKFTRCELFHILSGYNNKLQVFYNRARRTMMHGLKHFEQTQMCFVYTLPESGLCRSTHRCSSFGLRRSVLCRFGCKIARASRRAAVEQFSSHATDSQILSWIQVWTLTDCASFWSLSCWMVVNLRPVSYF